MSNSKRTDFFSFILRRRWVLGALVLAIAVLFQLNGSSVGMWNAYTYKTPQEESAVIAGADRGIRSDEWCVFTPMAMSQYYNHFRRTSSILRASNTDVYMVYGQSVRDWSAVFRPFQLGYLFLSPARGLSFYWCSKLIALFLVSLSFGLMITERKQCLALTYAFLVTLAPVVQWWFSTNAFPDMLVYGQGMILCLSGYLRTSSYKKRILYAAGLSWLAGAYLLVIYPAWQVPFFYVFLAIGIWVIFSRWNACSFCWKKDVPILAGALAVLCVCMALIIHRSWDVISAVLHSVYPGERMETGGIGISGLFRYVGNPGFPFFEDNVPGNVCEMATFYDLFPLGLLVSILLLRKRKDRLSFCLLAVTALLGLYVTVGFPLTLSRVTLLNHVQAGRCMVALSYANLLLLIRACAVWRGRRPVMEKLSITSSSLRCAAPIAGVALAVFIFLCAFTQLYSAYFTSVVGGICAAVLICSYVCFLWGEKAFCLMLCAVSLGIGATVNPVRIGLRDIENNALGIAIQNLAEQKEGKWLAVSKIWIMGDFPVMFGAPTLNSTNTYMNQPLWEQLDPKGTYEDVYNRYAHVEVSLSKSAPTTVKLLGPDLIHVSLEANQLPRLGVRYVVSDQDLRAYGDVSVSFHPVFSREDVRYTVFRVEIPEGP